MKVLNIKDIVRLTNKINNAIANREDEFAIVNTGDHITLHTIEYGLTGSLRVYVNQERIETITVDYLVDGGIPDKNLVKVFEKLDEELSFAYKV